MEFYLDRTEVAEKIKVAPSRIDFWRRRKDNPLPFKRIGKLVRYVWPEVEKWINSQNG